ncbi:MAG: hypothetical protein KKF67_01075 [Nanoarchaeota archaeon]|nr:hypothetical protein [Nanoarchaeota archaeon]
MQETRKIENPWCVYGDYPAWGFGKVVANHRRTVDIIKSERWSSEPWYSDYITRFNTLEEAAKEYQKQHNNCHDVRDRGITDETIKERMMWSFPSYFKDKK